MTDIGRCRAPQGSAALRGAHRGSLSNKNSASLDHSLQMVSHWLCKLLLGAVDVAAELSEDAVASPKLTTAGYYRWMVSRAGEERGGAGRWLISGQRSLSAFLVPACVRSGLPACLAALQASHMKFPTIFCFFKSDKRGWRRQYCDNVGRDIQATSLPTA